MTKVYTMKKFYWVMCRPQQEGKAYWATGCRWAEDQIPGWLKSTPVAEFPTAAGAQRFANQLNRIIDAS